MCLACEGADLELRWELIEIISTGRMPAGHTAADLRAMGLPLPGEVVRERQPDGTVLIRQVAPSQLAANAFACDAPEPAATPRKRRVAPKARTRRSRVTRSERGRD